MDGVQESSSGVKAQRDYTKAQLRNARFSISAAFFGFAFVTGSWAPRIPAVKDTTGVNDAYLGVALAGLAVGALVGTRLASYPIERIGSARCSRLSLLAVCLTVLGPGLVTNFAGLLVALTVFGLAIGVLDVAVNAQGVVVERAYRRPIMSGLHGLYSVGALTGAATAGIAAHLGVRPPAHFTAAAVLAALGSLIALRGLLPEQPTGDGVDGPDAGGTGSGGGKTSSTSLLWSPAVLSVGLIAFGAMVAEGAAADWSAVFLRDSLHTGEGFAASAITVFSLAMAVTRFVADRLVARFGPVAVVRTGALIAAVGFGAGLIVGRPIAAVIGFGLLGAGLAPVVPTTFSAAGNLGDRSSAVLGRVVAIGYLGSTTGPIQIGLLAAALGLPAALGLLAVLAVVIAMLAGWVAAASGRSGHQISAG